MKKKLTALLVGAALMLAAGSAWATPMLRLFDGTTMVTIADGGAGDVNSSIGAVTYVGPIGNWTLNVATGLTKPFQGTTLNPYMDLNSINSTNASGGILQIVFSETGFIGNSAVSGFTTDVGGTTQGNFVLNSYYDVSNTIFGTASPLANLGPFSPVAFSGSETDSAAIAAGDNYSLTLEAIIFHRGAGTTSFDASLTPVPEPGTMVLLGAGLLGLAVYGKRRMNKEA